MRVFVDGHDQIVLGEYVHLLGPRFDASVALLGRTQVRIVFDRMFAVLTESKNQTNKQLFIYERHRVNCIGQDRTGRDRIGPSFGILRI